ncbi:MAG: HipA N-terminal domain-containing protein [Bacteroides cellulosilyticus]
MYGRILTETDDGKYIFHDNDSYLLTKQTAISISFPKSQQEFVSDTLFPFLGNSFQRQTKPFNAKRSK